MKEAPLDLQLDAMGGEGFHTYMILVPTDRYHSDSEMSAASVSYSHDLKASAGDACRGAPPNRLPAGRLPEAASSSEGITLYHTLEKTFR